jgi:hypothetical protein
MPQTNPFIPSLCSRENKDPLGTNPAYVDCHSAAKEPVSLSAQLAKYCRCIAKPGGTVLTFQNPTLSKPQSLNHPRRKQDQDSQRDERTDDWVVPHKSLNTINHTSNLVVDLAERISHRASGLDGVLHGLEDGFGEVLAPAVRSDDLFEGLSQLEAVFLGKEDGVDEGIGGARRVPVYQLYGGCCLWAVPETLVEEVHGWQILRLIGGTSAERKVSRKLIAPTTDVACDRLNKDQSSGPCRHCWSYVPF